MQHNGILVFFVLHTMLLQYHHCIIVGPKIRQETAVERQCNNFGTSVGRLEWRALLTEDELNVSCNLNPTDPTLHYDILWTYGFETESRVPLRQCAYDQTIVENDTEILCHYKHKISKESEHKKLMCWVKTRNMWDSESRTACFSEEIPLYFATYEVPDTTDILITAPPVRKEAFTETLRPDEKYLISKSEEDYDEEFAWKQDPFIPGRVRRYTVEATPDIERMCEVALEDNSTVQVLWEFWMRTNLDKIPQNIQWNCSVSYDARFSGIFTLFFNKGIINKISKKMTNSIVIKKCKRSPELNNRFVKCGLAWNLTESDLGGHAVSAHFKHSPSGRTRKDAEHQECILQDDYIRYHVTRATPNKTLKLTAAEKRLLAIEDLYEPPSRPSRNLVLPWDTWPKGKHGITLKSKELILFSIGGILSICLLGCVFARWRTVDKIKIAEGKAKVFIRENPRFRCRCSEVNATN